MRLRASRWPADAAGSAIPARYARVLVCELIARRELASTRPQHRRSRACDQCGDGRAPRSRAHHRDRHVMHRPLQLRSTDVSGSRHHHLVARRGTLRIDLTGTRDAGTLIADMIRSVASLMSSSGPTPTGSPIDRGLRDPPPPTRLAALEHDAVRPPQTHGRHRYPARLREPRRPRLAHHRFEIE